MLVIIAVVVGVVLVGLLGYAATRPNTFWVARTQPILASPGRIFRLIEDYRQWAAWSPYEKLDPTMQKTFSGSEKGQGAVYSWAGNNKAGKGRMEIIDAVSTSLVRIKLDFLKPFEGHNTAEFTLAGKGGATNVTWAMYGPMPFPFKVMSIFVNIDNMPGKEFAAGLTNLKAIAENKAVAAPNGAD
jgi:hypothetical protein